MNSEGHYRFFQNTLCEFFPCHPTDHPEDFNCLFCYCPLYALGRQCRGNYKYNERGVKDCSGCITPHLRENYAYITGRYQEILRLVQENDQKTCGFSDGEAVDRNEHKRYNTDKGR